MNTFFKSGIFIILLFLLTFNFPSVFAQESGNVVIVEIDGEIRAGTAQFLNRALKEAEDLNAALFLIELNTPGGLLKSTEEITRLLLDSKVKTAVFVNKRGGWAFSAGTFILLASEVAIARPDSSLGAAQPRALGITTVEKPDDKIIEATAQWIKNIAASRNRNTEISEKFVRENLTLSGSEALDKNIIDFTAEDRAEALTKLNLQANEILILNPSTIETVLSFISIPQIASLLLTIGVLGIILVFRTGEIESIGLIAALSFLLGLGV